MARNPWKRLFIILVALTVWTALPFLAGGAEKGEGKAPEPGKTVTPRKLPETPPVSEEPLKFAPPHVTKEVYEIKKKWEKEPKPETPPEKPGPGRVEKDGGAAPGGK